MGLDLHGEPELVCVPRGALRPIEVVLLAVGARMAQESVSASAALCKFGTIWHAIETGWNKGRRAHDRQTLAAPVGAQRRDAASKFGWLTTAAFGNCGQSPPKLSDSPVPKSRTPVWDGFGTECPLTLGTDIVRDRCSRSKPHGSAE
jgi:hypothetical protein